MILAETVQIEGGLVSIGDETLPLSRPVHEVTIAPFRMMIGTVTNQQYATFVRAGGYRDQAYWSQMGWRWRQSKHDLIPPFWNDYAFNQPSQPIVGISWYEALAFANWHTAHSDYHWRLPTEIEWEVVAQDVGVGKIHTASSGVPRPINAVGQGYQTASGVWNLLGNIWEWCSTRWGRNWQQLDYPYPYHTDDDREDLSGSYARVMRGGSWFDPLQDSHPAKRARFLPGSRASNIGFRLVTSSI